MQNTEEFINREVRREGGRISHSNAAFKETLKLESFQRREGPENEFIKEMLIIYSF